METNKAATFSATVESTKTSLTTPCDTTTPTDLPQPTGLVTAFPEGHTPSAKPNLKKFPNHEKIEKRPRRIALPTDYHPPKKPLSKRDLHRAEVAARRVK